MQYLADIRPIGNESLIYLSKDIQGHDGLMRKAA